METNAAVLVARKRSSYRDIPGVRYHFPKKLYLRDMQSLTDALVLFYEPRRGGTSAASGGRMGFFAFAFVDRIEDDAADPSHAFVWYRYYCEFVRVVPLEMTSLSPKSLQRAVRPIPYAEAEAVVKAGLFMEVPLVGQRVGMTEAEVLSTVPDRETREVIHNRAIRDASFRFRVVEQAYAGRCALTGIRIVNGHGRAEVEAAHIQPVEAGGPDATQNGLALMRSMHWAFDRGLVTLSDSGEILIVERGLDASFFKLLPEDRRAILPDDPDKAPHSAFLRWHRTHCFKGTLAAS